MEKSPNAKQSKKDERKEAIWWRPLTIEGIEGITLQVDTVIKQFHELHLSEDPESANLVEEFLKSIEKRINELSRFYKENRGDERAILFELQSLKLRQLFRAWGAHTSHNCMFADVALSLTSAPSLKWLNQLVISAFNNPFTPVSSTVLEEPDDEATITEENDTNNTTKQQRHAYVPSKRPGPRTPPRLATSSTKKGYIPHSRQSTSTAPTKQPTATVPNGKPVQGNTTITKNVTSNVSKQQQNTTVPIEQQQQHQIVVTHKKAMPQEKIKRVKLFKPKRTQKNFIKDNMYATARLLTFLLSNAFRASAEGKKWYKEFTEKDAENPTKRRKPLYYWEMEDYCKKAPPKLTEIGVAESTIHIGDPENDVIMAEFQVLLSKQEVEELLVSKRGLFYQIQQRREKLIKVGVLSALQTHPFLQKHVGKLAYGTNGYHVNAEQVFLHSSAPFLDSYTAQTVALRHTAKQKWFSQQDFMVFPKPEQKVSQASQDKHVTPPQKEVVTDDDVIEKRFPFMELSYVPPLKM